MRHGNDPPSEQPDPFDEYPHFDPVPEVTTLTKDDWIKTALEQADKIRRTARDRGIVSDDEHVIEAVSIPEDWVPKKGFYIHRVGPLAVTCENLEWGAAYSMNLAEAPEPGGKEWAEAAGELSMPTYPKAGPSFVKSAYKTLYEYTEETGRPLHTEKLIHDSQVYLKDREYPVCFKHLDQLPGVNPPADKFAWQWVEPETETAASAQTGENHA